MGKHDLTRRRDRKQKSAEWEQSLDQLNINTDCQVLLFARSMPILYRINRIMSTAIAIAQSLSMGPIGYGNKVMEVRE